MRLKQVALEREKAWRDYELPASYLADFALSELAQVSVDEYALDDIFSKPALEALLGYSSKSVNAYRAGSVLVSAGSSGMREQPRDEGYKLEALLRAWAGKGWISISEVGGEDSFIAAVLS